MLVSKSHHCKENDLGAQKTEITHPLNVEHKPYKQPDYPIKHQMKLCSTFPIILKSILPESVEKHLKLLSQ